ncbi:MAG: hypothetical protein C0412_19090, partial [Flavobacterium sp.]|nr:hypothetical protein [Flavobacterium sp.]
KETGFNALEMANQFYETGLFASAEPEFLQMPELHTVNKNKIKDKGLLVNNIQSKNSNKNKFVSNVKTDIAKRPSTLSKKNSIRSVLKSTKVPPRQNDSVIDPLYAKQWYFDHTLLPDKFRDTVSIVDLGIMKKAWGASQGDDVIVGVFDDGIDGTHIDFKGENYDITRPNKDTPPVVIGIKDGKPVMGPPPSTVKKGDDYSNIKNAGTRYGIHGTAIAGIIAAIKTPSDTLVSDLMLLKNVGGVGVAPRAKLYSIALPFHTYDKASGILSNDYDVYTTNQQFADGFGEATENGIQVLNCSWTTNGMHSDMLDDAISNALYNGRNGKGMVIVFSAGNDDVDKIGYPANSNPDILVVGAMSPCGERIRKGSRSCESSGFWGSNYGSELDLMAFGTDIITTSTIFPPSIFEATFQTDDFVNDFEGTSASAAMVSGIAALILHKKPNLTAKQVGIIIQHSSVPEKNRQEYRWGRTTEKTGSTINYAYGLDYQIGNYLIEEGFGLVKADEGVEYSNKFEPRISKAIPAKAATSNRTTNSITCIWPSSLAIGQPYFNGIGYEYFYTKDGSKVPNDTETANGFTYKNSVNLKGLDTNSNYRFFIRVVGICPLGAVPGQTDRSKWSEPATFNTNCSVPTELKSSNGLGLTTISWSVIQPNVPSGEGYDYYVSTNGTPPVFSYKEIKSDGTKVEADNNTKPTGSVNTPFILSAILKNLQPNQKFEFWVRSKCEKSIWVYGGEHFADFVSPDQNVCYGTKPSNIFISNKDSSSIEILGNTTNTLSTGSSSLPEALTYTVVLPEIAGWQKSSDEFFTLPENIPDSNTLVLKGDVIGEITERTYFRAVINNGPVELYTNPVMVSPGSVTTWSDGVWSDGEPTFEKAAIIKGDYSDNIKDLTACTLVVQDEAKVTVPNERVYTITNKVIVKDSANLIFKPRSSLMQSGDANTNIGSIFFEGGRFTTTSGRVCVSAPVENQKLSTFPITGLSSDGYGMTVKANVFNFLDVASGNYLPVNPDNNNFISGVGYEIG